MAYQLTGRRRVEVTDPHLADADEMVVPHGVEFGEGGLAGDQEADLAPVLDGGAE